MFYFSPQSYLEFLNFYCNHNGLWITFFLGSIISLSRILNWYIYYIWNIFILKMECHNRMWATRGTFFLYESLLKWGCWFKHISRALLWPGAATHILLKSLYAYQLFLSDGLRYATSGSHWACIFSTCILL